MFIIDEIQSDKNSMNISPEKTLIILHGFPTSTYDYVDALDYLKTEFSRVILMDFIGFGFSDKPSNYSYSLFE